ncbi:MAG TPA: alanine racemase [Anaerolineae bacterium]|mgnify:CR=1 FL=1|nr:alanine racemase [Anaerolineae bacterium]HOR00343.1 alanine racemase [Anaerolineae bacterium]HPL26933.1 alanine racemase [Anaerolineae bacterium]
MVELEDLLQATAGLTHGPVYATRFTDFCYDSRQVAPGQLFVAVRTGWADGHDYVPEACRGGAQGVLCDRPVDLAGSPVTCIVVQDTQTALADWARLLLQKHQVEVVGITGSTGKTTTKEAIAAVLSSVRPVFKSPGNYSGRFGLPIALGQLRPEHRLAVLELACDSPGEMAELARVASPRYGVVLNVSAAHLETMGSLENVALEKGRLVASLPADGWAVLNRDDPWVTAMAERCAAPVLWIGQSPEAHLRATDIEANEAGVSFTLSCPADLTGLRRPVRPAPVWFEVGGHPDGPAEACQVCRIRSRLLGRHAVYPLLAAAAVGLIHGLSLEQIARALQALDPLPGRLRPLAGRNGALILDDSFSATPAAVEAALQTLAGVARPRKIAVLGDMAQLGAHEAEAHRRTGALAAGVVDLLVANGERMRLAAEEAGRHGLARERIHVTYTVDDALRAIEPQLGPGVAILVKGSAEARLEQLVRRLLPDERRADAPLVRQGPGWQAVRLKRPSRPTWVEIDLEAIAHNVRLVRRLVGERVALMAILKADGYGHGAIKTARTALNNGATYLGVACLSEALALRQVGIEAPILVLGYTPPWQARETVASQVDAAVFSIETAEALSRAAVELGRPARVHVKVDTGMGRLGLLPEETLPFMLALAGLPGLEVQGLFTHFAMADCADRTHCNEQWRRFSALLAELEQRGLRPPLVHAANSAATLTMPEAHCDMVRVGVALYGLNPSADVPCPAGFRQALTFKTQIAQVKTLPAGSCVSYCCAYHTPRDSRVAVIPVGYADGFRRAPQHWGHVLVRGQRAPIVGRVCMDQTMIDVTDIPGVRYGDEVVLIGTQGRERITVDEVAAQLGTINYEVVSEILARVPRVS